MALLIENSSGFYPPVVPSLNGAWISSTGGWRSPEDLQLLPGWRSIPETATKCELWSTETWIISYKSSKMKKFQWLQGCYVLWCYCNSLSINASPLLHVRRGHISLCGTVTGSGHPLLCHPY